MRFIGNHPIPEHVNPPEDVSLTDQAPEDAKEAEKIAEGTQSPSTRRRRGRPSIPKPSGNREAA